MKTITFTTIFIVFFYVVPCFADECDETTSPTVIASLPVFLLESPIVDRSEVEQISQILFASPGVEFNVEPVKDNLTVKSGLSIIEVSTKSHGIWFADKSQLWNTQLTPTLISQDQAKATADRLFDRMYRQNRLSRYSVIAFSNFGKTLLSRYKISTQNRTDKQLDIQVNYVTKVKPFPDKPLTLSVVGGGGEFNFSFGDQGKLISHSGVWRSIKKVEKVSEIISKEESDRQFRKLTEKIQIDSFQSYLAYYSAPSFMEQKFLYPVYVYDSVAIFDNEKIPLKTVILPATRGDDYGQEPSESPYVEPRPDDDSLTMRPGSTDAEGDDTTAGSSEVGAYWILSGLKNTRSETEDFVNALTKAGWTKNFIWGDTNAWERDWNKSDDLWVDAADFVYYSGHASNNMWELSTPDNGKVLSRRLGAVPESPGDLWGEQDLEWIIISACGPLHDDQLNGIGSVFGRWSGVFDGLHQLLGYASKVYDFGWEGQKVAEYMLNGDPIIDSWFRAAREVQPTCNTYPKPYGKKIYAGVIYAEQESARTNVRDDHLWGIGTVSADPKPPDVLYALWTST